MALALFDLDNTLLGGDSDHSWGEFLCDQKIVDSNAYKQANDRFFQDYQNGTLDIVAYQEFALEALKHLKQEKRDELHQQFMHKIIQPMILPKAVALVKKHQAQNDLCVVITATNSFVTAPIVKAFGIEHLLATEPEIHNNEFTGKIIGTPCFQEGKIVKLQAWLAKHDQPLEGAYFYSDSFNDLPLLKEVDHPYAVDPDDKLLHHAQANAWPVISLR